jgi:hypothetical protein
MVSKFSFKGIFGMWMRVCLVACTALLWNELNYYYSCRQIAKDFMSATKGLNLYEFDHKVNLKSPETDLPKGLQTYVLDSKRIFGNPQLHVMTDANTSSVLKLEQSGHIVKHSLNPSNQDVYTNDQKKILFGGIPSFIAEHDGLHKLSNENLLWKLQHCLLQESLIFRYMGMTSEVLFFVLFIMLNVWFASFTKFSAAKLITLRFFGISNRAILPVFMLKNGVSLVGVFLIVGAVFFFLDFYLPWSIYLISYVTTMLSTLFWSWITLSRYQTIQNKIF